MIPPETDTPDDDLDNLAAEFYLGLLDEGGVATVSALRQQDARFEAVLSAWERQLMPLVETLQPVVPPNKVWADIAARIGVPGTATHSTGLWDNVKFWRYFSLGITGLGAAVAAMVLAALLSVHPQPSLPAATAALTSPNNGIFVVTAQTGTAGTLLVVSPSHANVPANKTAELWLLLPGQHPAPLGLLSGDHPVAIRLAANRLGSPVAGAELAVSMEPLGGSPTGAPTGPVIAAAKFSSL